jgi:ERCC4-related helicase
MDYRGPYPRPTGKYKNADEFKRLVGYRYFARTRKSSGATMTDCSADVLISDLSDVQKELLRKTSMPYMVYDCPSYFYPDLIEDTENTPKMKDLLRLVSEFTDNGESVLIYAIYREAQSAIQNLLFGYGIHCEIMNGETKIQEKNELIDRFKSGELKVLITNVQKGLNFGHCNRCIFYSYDTNPNKMVQFEGRMTREYNIRDKHVYLLISRGKELDRFKTMVADRAVASDMFAGSDFSCVLTLLLDENRIKQLE